MMRRSLALIVSIWWSAGGALFAQTNPGRWVPRPFTLTQMQRMLSGKIESQRAMALGLLDSQMVAHPTIADAVKESIQRDLRSEQVSPLTVHAVHRLGLSSRDADAQYLVTLTETEDAQVVLAAAVALLERKQSEQLPLLVRLAQRPEFQESYGFRRSLVDAVAAVPDKASVDFLIDVVSRFEGQLRFHTAQHLSRLTNQNFGGRVDQWADWWTQHADGFQPAVKKPEAADNNANSSAQIPWQEPLPEFCGAPIYARRVVFVIDRSGSMATQTNGVSRLNEARYQLKNAIEKLDRYVLFNIVEFNATARSFQSELVPADETHKKEARDFLNGLTAKGAPQKTDALMTGLLADPNLEALYFITDGECCAWARLLHNRAITARNSTRRTSIFTVGADCDEETRDYLQDLSRRNNGEFLRVR